jgi:hypothetical protein
MNGRPADAQIKELARQAWYGLPLAKRSIRAVHKAVPLASLSSIQRWAKDWRENPDAEILPPEPAPVPPKPPRPDLDIGMQAMPQPEPEDEADLSSLPMAMQEALDPRLRPIARLENIEQGEGALCKMLLAFAKRADEIVTKAMESEDPNAPSNAVHRLTVAMQIMIASKVQVSVAHRNFSEGDMLGGTANKFNAEARRLYEDGRANRAKEIDGQDVSGEDSSFALAALRGRAEGK